MASVGKLHFRSTNDDNGFSEEIQPIHVKDGRGWVHGLLRDEGDLFDASGSASGILDTTYTATSSATFTVATLDIASLTDAAADLTDLEDMIQSVDTAFGLITTGASNLGAASKRIELQSEFVGNLMDAIERGVSQLVDADMNEESTKLQALQVQQQLGIQALSIANSGSQNILSLFR